jgi:hypothetical protein
MRLRRDATERKHESGRKKDADLSQYGCSGRSYNELENELALQAVELMEDLSDESWEEKKITSYRQPSRLRLGPPKIAAVQCDLVSCAANRH